MTACYTNRLQRNMSSSNPADEARSPKPSATDCWYLSGPTACGKTDVGVELARLLDAEIIAMDSMTLYRGMAIGTAKPTEAQRNAVPHHLLDLLAPDQPFSLSHYVDAAHEKIAEIRDRGHEALFVGGTPLYLKSLLRGILQGPPADWTFRREIESELEQVGLPALFERLQQVDPLAAAKLHPNDKRRIIRALEVYRTTGRPLSHMQLQFDESLPAQQCRVFVLKRERSELHDRINRRVDQMFAAGFVGEVQSLLERYGDLSYTAWQAVGYREVREHLEGRRELNAAIEAIKARTRQFARRQETWFRSLSECRFVAIRGDEAPEEIARRIIESERMSRDAGDS